MYIKVKVTPSAKKEKVEKGEGDVFKISVKEPTERNLANRRVLEIIADHFGVLPKEVRIISGHHRPNKLLCVSNTD